MNHLHSLFIRGLSWCALESITTQALLACHTICLFRILPITTYGLTGIIFSICYLIVTIATTGLDSTLGPIQATLTSKDALKESVQEQSIYSFSLLCISLCIALGIYFPFIQDNMPLCIFIVGISIVEILKKIAKSYMALMGEFRKVAYTELILICSYISMVWGIYAYMHIITLFSLFIPLFISTFIAALYSAYQLISCYSQLPKDEHLQKKGLYRHAKLRMFSWLTHITHCIFSGNVLVPLIASTVGIQHAAILKLVSNCIHTAIATIEKVFGLTSTVLFAYTNSQQKQYVFSLITRYLSPLIVVLSSMGMYGVYTFLFHQNTMHLFPFLLAYSVIHINNLLALTYEKLLLNQTKGAVLINCTLIATALALFSWYITGSTYTYTLMYIALSRCIYCISLAGYTYIKFNIKPSFPTSIKPLLASAFILMVMYFSL